MSSRPEGARHFLEWMVERCEFFPPRVVLQFEDLLKEQMDVVEEFFTRQQENDHQVRAPTQQEQSTFIKCEVGLPYKGQTLSMHTLSTQMLSTQTLRWVQLLLDEIAAQDPSTRLSQIHFLTVGDQQFGWMNPVDVKIVAEILQKNHVYQLRDITSKT